MIPSDAPPVILLAEDDASLRGMLAFILRARGFDVLLGANGAEARDHLLGDAHIDLALFDLSMPLVTGDELLTLLRSDPRRAAMPAIAMSAYSDPGRAQQSRAAGADVFLAKPFAIEELMLTIQSLLTPRA